MLACQEVTRVEVFHIPGEVLTRIPITPETLESQCRYQLTILDIRGGINEQTLLTEAQKTVLEPL